MHSRSAQIVSGRFPVDKKQTLISDLEDCQRAAAEYLANDFTPNIHLQYSANLKIVLIFKNAWKREG